MIVEGLLRILIKLIPYNIKFSPMIIRFHFYQKFLANKSDFFFSSPVKQEFLRIYSLCCETSIYPHGSKLPYHISQYNDKFKIICSHIPNGMSHSLSPSIKLQPLIVNSTSHLSIGVSIIFYHAKNRQYLNHRYTMIPDQHYSNLT